MIEDQQEWIANSVVAGDSCLFTTRPRNRTAVDPHELAISRAILQNVDSTHKSALGDAPPKKAS
jgi:hypothetical protein